MNRHEARIRDYLADHLDLIDPTLELVRKEFPLPNLNGPGGYIDILAKDRLGHFVVIEIKRSDQAARAALHELTKYVALLKSSLGIRIEKIRAVLLSTEWRELAIPFAEYQKICEVPTEGFVLTAEPNGTVTKAAPYVPRHADAPLKISRQQHVFLFSGADQRDNSVEGIVAAAKCAALRDFAVFAVDYQGGNDHVIFPHGAYFVFSSPLEGLPEKDACAVKSAISWEEELDDEDENFLVALMEEIDVGHEDSEIGYPEKLASIISTGWNAKVVYRAGRFSTNSLLLDDEQLINEARRLEGGANYYMCSTASKKYWPSWDKLKSDAELVLLGNKVWSEVFFHVVGTLEEEERDAVVSVHFYNLMNIVFSLGRLCSDGDTGYLPTFQIVSMCGEEVDLYVGFIGWNGQNASVSGREWIDVSYGSFDEFLLMQHFGEQFSKEDLACEQLGLSYIVLKIRNPGTKAEAASALCLNSGSLISMPLSKFEMRPISEFCSENAEFCQSLIRLLNDTGMRMTGPVS